METTFAQRLKQACDDSTIIPEYGKGRQVAISQRLGVTQEAVRKWFTGEAVPRQPKMRELAEYLEVEESWLALGIKPELDRNTKRRNRVQLDGAIYLVAGLLMLEGGNCAFPSDDDPRSTYVDLYAIFRGTQAALHVCIGREASSGMFQLIVPHQYADVRCLGVMPAGLGKYHFISLQTNLITEHRQRKAGDYLLHINRIDNRYYTGEDQWPRFKSVTEIV